MLIFVRRRQKCPSDSCCSRRAWVNTKPWGGPRAMKALHANWLLWSPPFSRPQDVAFNSSPHISPRCALSYNPHTCYVTYSFPVLCFKFPNIYEKTTKQWKWWFLSLGLFQLVFQSKCFLSCSTSLRWYDTRTRRWKWWFLPTELRPRSTPTTPAPICQISAFIKGEIGNVLGNLHQNLSDLLLKMSHFLKKGEIGNVSANLNPNLANLS